MMGRCGLASRIALALVCVSVASAAEAALTPAGEAFDVLPEIVNPPPVDPSPGGFLIRSEPTAIALADGFAVAFVHERVGADGTYLASDVEGRRVSRDGVVSGEFRASLPAGAAPGERAGCPIGAPLAGGHFALGWARDRAAGRDVWFERFDATGLAEPGSARIVGSALAGVFGDLPAIAGAGERSALSWTEVARDGSLISPPELTYRLLSFDGAGAPTASALRLGSPRLTDRAVRPAVSLAGDGGVTAAWIEPAETGSAGSQSAVYLETFDASGVARAPRLRVGLRAVGGVALVRKGDGRSIVAWGRRNPNGTVRITLSRVSATGRLAGKPVTLDRVSSFSLPVLLEDASGTYVLAWLEEGRLKLQHLGADLARKGAVVDVASAAPWLEGLARGSSFGAAMANGKLLVAWAAEMPASVCPANGIKARLYDLVP